MFQRRRLAVPDSPDRPPEFSGSERAQAVELLGPAAVTDAARPVAVLGCLTIDAADGASPRASASTACARLPPRV